MKSEASVFMEAVFGGKPEDLFVLVWTLDKPTDKKKSHWFLRVEEAIQFAENQRTLDVYIGVGLSSEDYGPHHRCKSDQTMGIVGLWADFDLKSEAHAKDNLPATVEEALELIPKEFPPTFIILTGNGIHCWWLFRQPLIFTTDDEREAAVCLAQRWQSLFRLAAAGHGWAFDRLKDLARLLRIPGTFNCKDPQNKKLVSIHSQTDRRYDPSDFLEFLDNQGIPSEEERERKEEALKQTFTDGDLVLDKNATIPPDMLKQFLAADPKFRLTWSKQREDMPDKSRSGYDFALANFGAKNGLSEQQTADLIFEHRRVNGDQQRNTQAYFKRTIGKAFKERVMQEFAAQQPADAMDKPASPTDRALLCEQISGLLGIRVVLIVKVAGQDPTYRMQLENTIVMLPSVEYLMKHHKLQAKIASAADHMIPGIKGARWTALVNMMLAALTVEDGGDEAGTVGSAKMYIDSYLRGSRFIDTNVEPEHQHKYLPAVCDGQITIFGNELLKHINLCAGERLRLPEISARLSALGAVNKRIKGAALRDQTRWFLPVADFPPEHYVPGIEDGTNA